MSMMWGQVLLPLALSIVTTFVLDNIHGLGFSPVWSFILASFCVLLLLTPVFYLRFIGAVFQSSGSWRVGGHWDTQWRYKKDGKDVLVSDVVRVRQWGSFVFGMGKGKSLSGAAPFNSYNYRFQGVINEEGLIEGKWQNIDPGRIYYGVFQLRIARSCNAVTGHWIGSARAELRKGEWLWKRIS